MNKSRLMAVRASSVESGLGYFSDIDSRMNRQSHAMKAKFSIAFIGCIVCAARLEEMEKMLPWAFSSRTESALALFANATTGRLRDQENIAILYAP
jgi:hypothetical protein